MGKHRKPDKADAPWAHFDAPVVRKVARSVPQFDRDGRRVASVISQDQPIRDFFNSTNMARLQMFMAEQEKYEPFLLALRSPEYARMSYGRIMQKFNITLHEINSIYQDGSRNLSLFAMADHLPDIVKGVADSAKPKQVYCPRCDGKGDIIDGYDKNDAPVSRTCPECKGTKEITQLGNEHAIDKIFESMKLTGVKAPLIAQQFNMGGAGSTGLDSNMEQILKSTQRVVLPEPDKRESAE